MRADHYDSFARSYATANESGLFNNYYARPAMIQLAGDVRGRRVLDAGCGSGPLVEDLRAGGADVSGFDSSVAMLELARERLGDDVDLRVADLSRHSRTRRPVRRRRRLARPALPRGLGRAANRAAPHPEARRPALLSVNHPRILESSAPEADYFAVTEYSEEYTFGDQQAVLTYWHRPLHAMSDAFTEAGFRIARISEPPFSPDTPRELLPPDLGDRTAFICFIFFVLEAG